jgi:hypothetical protein
MADYRVVTNLDDRPQLNEAASPVYTSEQSQVLKGF